MEKDMKESNAMLSRSVRLRKDTLDNLQKLADEMGVGITVYIRKVLESVVDNAVTISPVQEIS